MTTTPMMEAADITTTTDRHGLRDITERVILSMVADGWDFKAATVRFAEHIRDHTIAQGQPEMANGMGRLIAEIGASLATRLVSAELPRTHR